jgi:hypothetical protein
MLGGGSEYTFRLPLPFCQSCEVTAKRRPATFFHKGLVFGLLFAVGLLAVTITGIATGWLWPMEHPVLISMAFAAAVSFPWYSSRRPEPGQSSYYQPVRLLKLRQKFLSGVITGVKFGFSNHLYAEHLVSVNHEAVSSGILEITRL